MAECTRPGFRWQTEYDVGEQNFVYRTEDAAIDALSKNYAVKDWLQEEGMETVEELMEAGLANLVPVMIVW